MRLPSRKLRGIMSFGQEISIRTSDRIHHRMTPRPIAQEDPPWDGWAVMREWLRQFSVQITRQQTMNGQRLHDSII